MSVDLEALKRWQCDCCCVETELGDVVAALERIPELERRLDEAIDQNMRQATRLGRVEEAARFLVFEASSESEQAVAQMALIEVLSTGPALAAVLEGGVDGEWRSEGVGQPDRHAEEATP